MSTIPTETPFAATRDSAPGLAALARPLRPAWQRTLLKTMNQSSH